LPPELGDLVEDGGRAPERERACVAALPPDVRDIEATPHAGLCRSLGASTWSHRRRHRLLRPAPDLDPKTWRDVLAVDLDAVFGHRAAIPQLRRAAAVIVNTASISGFGDDGPFAYNAAKGAV
jgi:NAD(P)-dependent dehydrogenase (short-subunit alcohol dehydrogenase family)